MNFMKLERCTPSRGAQGAPARTDPRPIVCLGFVARVPWLSPVTAPTFASPLAIGDPQHSTHSAKPKEPSQCQP
jgi:hypothetical protein